MRMTTRIAATAGLLLLGPLRAEAAMEVTGPGFVGGTGAERGVVQIRCGTGVANRVWLSRGAVVSVKGDARRDVVLTAAHGLPETTAEILRDCRVLGPRALPYRIAEVWRAPGVATGMADDWAVLLVQRRLEGDVGRLSLAMVSDEKWAQLAGAAATVRVLLRQAAPDEGDCHLSRSTEPYEVRPTELLLYFCGATTRAPGLSGSPLLIGVDGRPLVIGVHLGWGLQMADDGGLHAVSLGRPIDGEIAGAIAAAVAAALR